MDHERVLLPMTVTVPLGVLATLSRFAVMTQVALMAIRQTRQHKGVS